MAAKKKVFLAVDLGAGSGRVVAGIYDGRKLQLKEIRRFANEPVQAGNGLHWNTLGLWAEIKAGIAQAVAEYKDAAVSVGVDTWGVDYGLVDERGRLLGNPFIYRDSRTDGMQEEALERVSREELYMATGSQFMFFNTVFQLLSEVVRHEAALDVAHRLLFMPDLFHLWLSGRMANERTIASTSQMLDPRTGRWAHGVLDRLGIPTEILGDVVEPGTCLGSLLPELQEELGAPGLTVVAPGSHDTASAVAAVPASTKNYAYLSSGTWSLMGIESPEPVINDKSRELAFTNEGGVCGTTRVLKILCGLWLVQECQRAWSSSRRKIGFDEMDRMAAKAKPFAAVIDPNDECFAKPCDMPAQIAAYARRTGQKKPADRGSILRTATESLAFTYRETIDALEDLSGRRLDVLHVVGGGVRNKLLNQFIANALDRPVVAGPVEATSAGNILMQMMATGEIRSLKEGRDLVRSSFTTKTYEPQDTARWAAAQSEYRNMMDSKDA